MRPQAVGDDVGLADVAAGLADRFSVVAEQGVDAGALRLVALQQSGEIRPTRLPDVPVQLVISAVVKPPGVPSTRNSLICLPLTRQPLRLVRRRLSAP